MLKPQTHRVAHGQLTILPSRAVFVDFREGERRRSKRGEEVFVIDASGVSVRVYAAPHMDVPCCLAEPTATYGVDELPPAYWKQWNDAERLVDQLKQRTPKVGRHAHNTYLLAQSTYQNMLFHSWSYTSRMSSVH